MISGILRPFCSCLRNSRQTWIPVDKFFEQKFASMSQISSLVRNSSIGKTDALVVCNCKNFPQLRIHIFFQSLKKGNQMPSPIRETGRGPTLTWNTRIHGMETSNLRGRDGRFNHRYHGTTEPQMYCNSRSEYVVRIY